jgi:hypothetical protein
MSFTIRLDHDLSTAKIVIPTRDRDSAVSACILCAVQVHVTA